MVSSGEPRPPADFTAFVGEIEPRLYRALVATYGPTDGREATVDALSWAWEHWSRLRDVDNKLGYLYRVGQSAVRRFGSRPVPIRLLQAVASRIPEITPELVPALAKLPTQQRTVVVLVYAYSWSQAEVADVLGVSASTVHEHLSRAIERLRAELEVADDR